MDNVQQTKKYADDSLALHTDLYQVNMVETYWAEGMSERRAVFELFFRKLPFGNGYAIFAGLERIIEYVQSFGFTDSDLAYLNEELGYEEDFLAYLKQLRFTGKITAMREGELVFGNEAILRVEGTLAEAQFIETALLNIVNYQTLIATKASRIRNAVGDAPLLEFGTRRAHEMDAALWGSRAAIIGGCDATSNVRCGKRFGAKVSGTHAHAMVQAMLDEYEAFLRYAERQKKMNRKCVFLIDTYDTLKSGIHNAIRVVKELGIKDLFEGVRLDSGDLAYLSKEVRKLLNKAGFQDTKIYASNDLDEYTVLNLKSQGAVIDAWGIGTKLITAYDQPALGAVYKIVAIEDDNGKMVDTIKISGNPEKVTTPGRKKLYRIINLVNHRSEGDYIALEEEKPQEEGRLKMFHPVYTYISKFVTNYEARELHADIFLGGKLVYEMPQLYEVQAFAKGNLELLWDEYKRNQNPEDYPVDLSQRCWDNKMNLIHAMKEKAEGVAKET
ncbi:nicotinate phosphoribosyltransferase [Paenibacillus sp. JDR-2]|uniref:nicotinate phosphoribosyltransferase n=1 Tax=Paenibacillus sp. (strain JDR-2) TaxID=324057 RepID=UPI00016646F8|nr:nicotinate phosphoribosyltransferase [Paenibacillus sp. JDR-2]ACT04121.1 nicotinate phosphoribosyltransferase [Paenibacillus sp. JDR-2]